jgi:mRNA-degrading endonuclease toxin of MazEF toxin-antitoxin module
VTRGDVYEYTIGNNRARIAIVSAAPYNPRRATFVVILGPDTPTPASPSLVPMAPADPVRGTIDITRLRPLVPDNVGARVGRLSRTTLLRVDASLRNYLGL